MAEETPQNNSKEMSEAPEKDLEKDDITPEQSEEEIVQEESVSLEKLQEALKASAQLVEEYKDRLLRSQADFDNYRKRTQKEKEDLASYAKEEVIAKLLPVLDNFDLALSHTSTDNIEAYSKGVEIVAKQLKDVLAKEGLEEIESDEQPFNPHYHHGVAVDNNPELEDQMVTETLQKGYQLGDKVIRPAMVKVNQK